MHLCHRDKVVIRKALQQLQENEKWLDIGLDDPITQHYGRDAEEVVYAAYRQKTRSIYTWACRNSRAVRRRTSPYDIHIALEELAREYRLTKPHIERLSNEPSS